MIRYRIVHRTEYHYGAPMTASHTVARLTPRDTGTQHVLSSSLAVTPVPEQLSHLDEFGNRLSYLAVTEPHDTLVVTATSEVDVEPPPAWSAPPVDAVAQDVAVFLAAAGCSRKDHDLEHSMTRIAFDALDPMERLNVLRCRHPSPLIPRSEAVAAYAAESFTIGRCIEEFAVSLCHRIFTDFTFDPTFSDISTPLEAVLEHRRGVCQDFAHLAIACFRSVGLSARYVSGYLETDPPPGQTKLVGSDASHAWCAVWTPTRGWFDIDPTNNQAPPHRHITVGWGRDYSDVAPVRGVIFGPPTPQELNVSVDVRRV